MPSGSDGDVALVSRLVKIISTKSLAPLKEGNEKGTSTMTRHSATGLVQTAKKKRDQEDRMLDKFLLRYSTHYNFRLDIHVELLQLLLEKRLLRSSWSSKVTRDHKLRVLRAVRVLTRDASLLRILVKSWEGQAFHRLAQLFADYTEQYYQYEDVRHISDILVEIASIMKRVASDADEADKLFVLNVHKTLVLLLSAYDAPVVQSALIVLIHLTAAPRFLDEMLSLHCVEPVLALLHGDPSYRSLAAEMVNILVEHKESRGEVAMLSGNELLLSLLDTPVDDETLLSVLASLASMAQDVESSREITVLGGVHSLLNLIDGLHGESRKGYAPRNTNAVARRVCIALTQLAFIDECNYALHDSGGVYVLGSLFLAAHDQGFGAPRRESKNSGRAVTGQGGQQPGQPGQPAQTQAARATSPHNAQQPRPGHHSTIVHNNTQQSQSRTTPTVDMDHIKQWSIEQDTVSRSAPTSPTLSSPTLHLPNFNYSFPQSADIHSHRRASSAASTPKTASHAPTFEHVPSKSRRTRSAASSPKHYTQPPPPAASSASLQLSSSPLVSPSSARSPLGASASSPPAALGISNLACSSSFADPHHHPAARAMASLSTHPPPHLQPHITDGPALQASSNGPVSSPSVFFSPATNWPLCTHSQVPTVCMLCRLEGGTKGGKTAGAGTPAGKNPAAGHLHLTPIAGPPSPSRAKSSPTAGPLANSSFAASPASAQPTPRVNPMHPAATSSAPASPSAGQQPTSAKSSPSSTGPQPTSAKSSPSSSPVPNAGHFSPTSDSSVSIASSSPDQNNSYSTSNSDTDRSLSSQAGARARPDAPTSESTAGNSPNKEKVVPSNEGKEEEDVESVSSEEVQMQALRTLRFMYGVDKNRGVLKRVFPAEFFSAFVDIGHYRLDLQPYRKLVEMFNSLPWPSKSRVIVELESLKGTVDVHGARVREYQILDVLGRGAFGTVYQVEKDNGSFFAMKELRLTDGDRYGEHGLGGEVKAICDEVEIISQLEHPRIVKYHQSFVEAGNLYIVMELVPGSTLADCIASLSEKKVKLSEEQVWGIFCQLCMALQYMHTVKKVVHRDLTPANVMLDQHGDVKIADFGLARQRSQEDDMLKSAVGTISYSCPEIVKNEGYTDKADIWSLGCVLYHMCALRPPFRGDNPLVVAQRIVKAEYEPLPQGEYSPLVSRVITALLTTDPVKRPAIAEVAVLIAPVLMMTLDKTDRTKERLATELAYERDIRKREQEEFNRNKRAWRSLLQRREGSQYDTPRTSFSSTGTSGGKVQRVHLSMDKLKEIQDPSEALLSVVHKLSFIAQLPPSLERDGKRSVILKFNRSLYQAPYQFTRLKMALWNLLKAAPEPVDLSSEHRPHTLITYEELAQTIEDVLKEEGYYKEDDLDEGSADPALTDAVSLSSLTSSSSTTARDLHSLHLPGPGAGLLSSPMKPSPFTHGRRSQKPVNSNPFPEIMPRPARTM